MNIDQPINQIALLTDSCADLSATLTENTPVFTIPLRILCKDGEYYDGVNIHASDIYRRLEGGELPKTSLPDHTSIESTLDNIAAKGYKKVIALHLSSGVSGTYNMVRLHAQERNDMDIRVFDTKSGSLGIGSIVLQIWADIQNGMEWEELIHTRVPQLIANTTPFFSVDTLEYLQKGGRIGKVAAMAGTLLQIKPIISFAEDGQLTSVAKVRGRKAVQGKLVELVRNKIGTHTRYNLAVAHGGAPEEMEALMDTMKECFPNYEHFWSGELDATLSVYIGAGILGAGVQILEEGECK